MAERRYQPVLEASLLLVVTFALVVVLHQPTLWFLGPFAVITFTGRSSAAHGKPIRSTPAGRCRPVVGWLFKRVDEAKELEELMVFITPRIAVGGTHDLAGAEQRWRESLKATTGTSNIGRSGLDEWRDRQ